MFGHVLSKGGKIFPRVISSRDEETQMVNVQEEGILVGNKLTLNFIGATTTATLDEPNNRINITNTALTSSELDSLFLKLDASNDPITNNLTIERNAGPGVAALFIDNISGIGNTAVSFRENGVSRFDFTYSNVTHIAKLQALEAGSTLQLLGDNGTGITIDENGNVGIGTKSPDTKLSIQAPTGAGVQTIQTIKNSSGGTRIKFKFDTNNVRWYITDQDGGIDFAYDESSGFIGIGTSDPLVRLHVKDSGEQLRLEHTSATGNPFLSFYQNGTRRSFIQHNDTDDNLKIASEFGRIQFLTGTAGAESPRVTILPNGNVGINTELPTQLLDVNNKVGMTAIGGIAIKLTNETGSNTIKGQLVKADTVTNDAVVITSAGDVECFGVFFESGIVDGAEAWVVVAGIADVALDDNVEAVRGDWISTGVLAGYAATANSPAAAPTHFEEIGHCIESVDAGGEGTHILARCVLHFN